MNILHKIATFALINFILTIIIVFTFKEPVPAQVLSAKQPPKATLTAPPPTADPPVQSVQSDQTKTNPNNSLCIIVVDSQKYDVTEFRNIHGGGDIFTCGADMTAIFYSQHDKSYLIKMDRYKIT